MITKKMYKGDVLPDQDGNYSWCKKGIGIYDKDCNLLIKYEDSKDKLSIGRFTIDYEQQKIYFDNRPIVNHFSELHVYNNCEIYCRISDELIHVLDESYESDNFLETYTEEMIFLISDGWYFDLDRLGVYHNGTLCAKLSGIRLCSFVHKNKCIAGNTIYTFHIPYRISRKDYNINIYFE